MLVHTSAGTLDGNTVTTPALNITGANVIFAAISNIGGIPEAALSDSASNSWIGTSLLSATGAGGSSTTLFVKTSPSVNSTYTFTANSAGTAPAVCLIAADGYSSSDSGNNTGTGTGITSVQPGSITPGANNELILSFLAMGGVISSLAIDTGFSITDTQPYSAGFHYGVSFAYLIQTGSTSGVPINPTWSWTTATTAGAAQFGFVGTFTPSLPSSSAAGYLFFGQALGEGLFAGIGARALDGLIRRDFSDFRRLLSRRNDK